MSRNILVGLMVWLSLLSAVWADGLDSWSKVASGVGQNLNGVTYGQGRYVCVGQSGVILVSSNGMVWESVASGISSNLQGVAYGSNAFVAVGAGGTILKSTNGLNWEAQTSPTTNLLNGVAYANGMFLALGNLGTLLTSTDGIIWTARNSTTTRNLFGATAANGLIMVVGQGQSNPGTVLTSSNGVNWVDRSYPQLGVAFYCVAAGNQTFVAMDARGVAYSSKDGIGWTNRFATGADYIFGITFAQNLFVGVGGPFGGGSQRIVTSADGLNWKSRLISVTNSAPLQGVAYGNGYFIAVGQKGLIVKSGPVFSLRLLTAESGTASLWIDGEASRSYKLQVCTNPPAGTWLDLLTTTNTSESAPVTDTTADAQVRWYRGVMP